MNHLQETVARIEEAFPDWHVWFVPRAIDGHLNWCAQRWTGDGEVIHAGGPGELEALLALQQRED